MRFRCGQEASEKPDRRQARRSGGEGLDHIHAPLLPQEKILINGELVEGAQPPPGSAFSAFTLPDAPCPHSFSCAFWWPATVPPSFLAPCPPSTIPLSHLISAPRLHSASTTFSLASTPCCGGTESSSTPTMPPAFATRSSPVRQHPKKSEARGVRTSSLRCCLPPSNLCRCTRCRRAKRGR